MQTLGVLSVLVLIVMAVAGYLFLWPRWQRRWILSRPFPPAWEDILRARLPIYPHLKPALQRQLRELIQLFLSRKGFEGCAGLEVTDEIRVIIAAQACLLLLNRASREYHGLHTIYVYPSAFRAVRESRDELGLVSTQSHHLLGESWDNGKLVLAWDQVEAGVRDFRDGHNVVLHEFAHQLDHESGVTNGAPLLYNRSDYESWAAVFSSEYDNLRHGSRHSDVLDAYGATNPAEFFAVATETFFEEPVKLAREHHQLYQQLMHYYRVDPREWLTP